MRVLVACESSGTVREAFRAKGMTHGHVTCCPLTTVHRFTFKATCWTS